MQVGGIVVAVEHKSKQALPGRLTDAVQQATRNAPGWHAARSAPARRGSAGGPTGAAGGGAAFFVFHLCGIPRQRGGAPGDRAPFLVRTRSNLKGGEG